MFIITFVLNLVCSQMACSISKDVKAKYKSLKSNKTLYKTKKGKPTNELNVPEFKKDILNLVYKRDFSFTKDGYISIGTLNGRIKVSYYKNNYVNQFINCSDWEYGGAILKKYKNNLYLLLTVSREIETFTPNTVATLSNTTFTLLPICLHQSYDCSPLVSSKRWFFDLSTTRIVARVGFEPTTFRLWA